MTILFSLAAGLIFGLGLIVSGMSNPTKVLGFLDVAGRWDPSLAFVMAGAIGLGMLAFRFVRGKSTSFFGYSFQLPTARHVDRRLIVGSALFGIGWGLAGICPGPALVLLGAGSLKGAVFVLALLTGMGVFELWQRVVGTR